MKTIKQLEQEIEEKKNGCGAKKQYGSNGNFHFYTCGKKAKCPSCNENLIGLKATLKQTIAIKEMIEKHIMEDDYMGIDTKQSIKEILTKINGGKNGRRV